MADPFVDGAYRQAAERALRAFPIDRAGLEFVHLSENVTYRVLTMDPERSYALRLHRPSYNTIESLKSERAWTRALAAAGVAVPEPVLARSGEDYVAVDIDSVGETRWAGLARWRDGALLSQVLERETEPLARADHFAALGRLLAAAHNQAGAWTPPPGFSRRRLDADGLMGAKPSWGPFWDHPALSVGERDLFIQARDKLHAALSRLDRAPAAFSMIHADAHPHNIIVVAGGGLQMIDFDDAAFGWRLYDIAVALRSHQPDPDIERLTAALVRGYRSVRALPDEELALLPMFLLTRRLAEIGWLHQRPELGSPPHWDALKAAACAAAEAFTAPG
jgi:Ser/Thr protein kinase RdoA (MazF antagonist)